MGFFSKLLNQNQPAACVFGETHAVVRQIVTVLGFDVPAAPYYASTLVPAINAAAAYFDGEIARIPGPLDISAVHYGHAPLVTALFPTRQEIAHGIGRSIDAKQQLAMLAGADQPEAFALLGVRAQKDGSGYCDHTLRSLAAGEAGTRQGLRSAAMLRLVTAFGEHIDRLRKAQQLPRTLWNMENRKTPPYEESDSDKPVLAREELQPANMLNGLVAWLGNAAEHLSVVAGTGAPETPAGLAELRCRDRRRWRVCLVRFTTAEGVAAMHNESTQHRYIRI